MTDDINKYTILAAYCYWCKGSNIGYAKAFNNLAGGFNVQSDIDIAESSACAIRWLCDTEAGIVKNLNMFKVKNIENDIAKLTEERKAIQLDSLQMGHTFEHHHNLQERIKEIDSEVEELYAEIEVIRNV